MKKLLLITALCICANVSAQERKTGWIFGPLPSVGYTSDLGFNYGALCDIFYYGDGSSFPDYMHKFNVEASWYTKGSAVYHLFYDSKHLIPRTRLTFGATYLPSRMQSFYGFNGYASPYDSSFEAGYYAIKRDMLRILADFQWSLGGDFRLAAGVSFYDYNIGRIDESQYDDITTLYENYVAVGILDSPQGGSQFMAKAGIVYDTRDMEAAPSRGIYADALVLGNARFAKLALHFRHYIPLIENRLIVAYHLAYQGRIAGNAPWYMQQDIATLYLRQVYSEGLGGVNTIRGILFDRIVGDGLAWGNLEFRIRLFDFRLFGQEWYAALNPFLDCGGVVQPYRLAEQKASADLYSGRDESLHFSAGAGLKLVMNHNFVISAEWGKPFDSQDGPDGLNIGLNYIF